MRTTYFLSPLVLLALLIAGCSSTRTATAPNFADDPDVVAVIDGRPVTLDEFEHRYAKAVGGAEQAREDDVADYEDFLSRYVDFRLKVQAGVDAGLPNDPRLSQEIEEYRRNFARPYLLEQEVLEPIIREVYERQQEMIKARHILIRVDDTASPEDTVAAHSRIAAIVDSISAGADFGEMAFRHSEDPSAQREAGMPGARGDLGFFSAGQMVEPFESFAYSTPVGELSPVFRTQFGYHVLQVEDRQPMPPAIRVAHIMIDPSQHRGEGSAEEFAQQLLERIRAGEDFAELAREHSHDVNSGTRGGDIGPIQFSSRIVEPFKQKAFELSEPGDVSEVVETMFGFHIIKLLDRQEPPTYEQAYENIKQRVSRMPRAQEAERALAMDIRAELGARIDTTALLSDLGAYAPSELVTAIRSDSLASEVMQRQVAFIGDDAITLGDVTAEIASGRAGEADDASSLLLAAADRVLNDRAIDAGSRQLESRDPEFGDLMQEFRDGLVLFRFMEDSVWTAAAQDSVALQALYAANRGAYRYGDRTRVIGVSASRDSTINAFLQAFDERGLEAALDGAEGLRVDTTYIAGPTNSRYDEALELDAGGRTDVSRQSGRFVVLVNDGIDPAREKTFEEARPELVTAYQDQLEQKILAELRRRYAVQTYPERLQQAFDGGTGSQLSSTE